MLRAGRLLHKIALQAKSDGVDGPLPSGQPDETWADVAAWASVSASINPLSARELFAAQSYNSEITHSIRIRGGGERSGITAAHRVRFGTRYFTIHAVRNLEEGDVEMELLCSEGLNADE